MQDETLRNTLHERFEGYTSEPSDAVWQSIEKVLDEDEKAGGYGFRLLSPLVITLLIGSSAAALALVFFITDTEEQSNFPLADVVRCMHSSIAEHTLPETTIEEIPVIQTGPGTVAKPIVHTSQTNEHRTISPEPFIEISPLAVRSLLDRKSSDDNDFIGIYIPENYSKDPRITATYNFKDDEHLDYLLNHQEANKSSLTIELLLSSFVNVNSISTSSGTSKTTTTSFTDSEGSVVTKSNRLGEAELNFQGYFTKRIKGGLGVSVAYSTEAGLDEGDEFKTTQWSIGIPLTFGMDVLRHKRFGLSIYAKLLNDFDQRRKTIHSVESIPQNLTPTILESTTVLKDQIYRFGLQPMITGSFFATPRTSLSLGVSYRYYFNDSRISNVTFQRSPYLGVHVGLGYLL